MRLSKSQSAALKSFRGQESEIQDFYATQWGVKKIIASWPFIRVEMQHDKQAAPKDDYTKWRWLWSKCQFDPVELARATGLGENVLTVLDVAITNRLIYPNGEVSLRALKAVGLVKEEE